MTRIARQAIIWTSFVMLAMGVISCSTLTSEHTSWNFIQSVGGIKIGEARPVAKGEWSLPVECDVSGLTAVTTKPTILNSALVVKDVRWKVRQDKILVWVVTCVFTQHDHGPHWKQSITLTGLKQGTYTVQYLNPDDSTVDIRSIVLHE